MNTYRPEFFRIEELVPPGVHAARGARAWELLQVPALVTLDQLRRKFGRLVVNDWHAGGKFKESGLREFGAATGAKYSQHKFGGGFDVKPRDATVVEMFDYIRANPAQFPHLTTLEDVAFTPTWLHFDVRNHAHAGILVVKP